MSWQIIQQKDRYYSKILTLLFLFQYQMSEGERIKEAVFRSASIRDDHMNYSSVWCSDTEDHIQLGKCLWKINTHLIIFLEKIKCKPVAVDPAQVPAVTHAGLPDSWACSAQFLSSCTSPIAESHQSLPGVWCNFVVGSKSRTDLINAKYSPTPLAYPALLPQPVPGDSHTCSVFLVYSSHFRIVRGVNSWKHFINLPSLSQEPLFISEWWVWGEM